MPILNLERLQALRSRTFRLPPHRRVTTPEAAVGFVNERGFLFFWPVKGMLLPNLWTAVAGDRPVADEHDDPGHITWGWKDNALDRRVWYYGKILHRKATFISLEVVPFFYALSENYGDIAGDHLVAYEEGRLTMAAKLVYEALLNKGKMNTIDLRKEAHLTSKSSDSEFNRALEDLQADFKILPVGTAEAGAWKYAYQYDITARHFPDLPEKARPIGEAEARRKLAGLYLDSVGAIQLRDMTRLFGWPLELSKRTLAHLVENGKLCAGLSHPQTAGEWFALPELVDR
jgi:hypothetical protein